MQDMSMLMSFHCLYNGQGCSSELEGTDSDDKAGLSIKILAWKLERILEMRANPLEVTQYTWYCGVYSVY